MTTIYADELQMGDVVDYLGTPHRVAQAQRPDWFDRKANQQIDQKVDRKVTP